MVRVVFTLLLAFVIQNAVVRSADAVERGQHCIRTLPEHRNTEPASPDEAENVEDTGDHGPGVFVPDGLVFVQDVVYATAKSDAGDELKLTFDAYFPKQSGEKSLPVLVYIHGGGYMMGSKEMGRGLCASVARGGYFAVTVRYRFVQEARLPAAAEDVQNAIRFLRANAGELGIDAERIGVMGHSAGGHLSAYLGTACNDKDQQSESSVSCRVACVVDFFGPTDFEAMLAPPTRRMAERMFGSRDEEEMRRVMRELSPLRFVDSSDAPMLIIHGTEDTIVPITQSEGLYERLKSAGVLVEFLRVEGAGHDNMNREVYRKAAAFLDEHLGGSASKVFGSPRSE